MTDDELDAIEARVTGVVEYQPWRERAACRGLNPRMFLPERGESSTQAKAVCRSCDVRQECLDYALEHHERGGIWGGASERQRKVMLRGRPRPVADHGTRKRYDTGCRCEDCKAAARDYMRRYRFRPGVVA